MKMDKTSLTSNILDPNLKKNPDPDPTLKKNRIQIQPLNRNRIRIFLKRIGSGADPWEKREKIQLFTKDDPNTKKNPDTYPT